MKLSFSERLGLKKPKTELVKEELTDELRNSLWTVVCESALDLSNQKVFNYNSGQDSQFSPLALFYRRVWIDFFKLPIDDLPIDYGEVSSNYPYERIRKWFFLAKWNEVYEFVEFCVEVLGDHLTPTFNEFLKRELSAYRLVGNSLVEINSKEEIIEIERALNSSDKYRPARIHLTAALTLISSKTNPDYRNSIKESISAVESLCKIILESENSTLGEALKIIEKKHNIPNSLKSGFSAIYGYTSDSGGIRHALVNGDINVGIDEARFMVIACSAFINYLISKT